MVKWFRWFLMFVIIQFMAHEKAYSVIGPVRLSDNGNIMLISSEEIKLVTEEIDFYHHPIGIWLVEYQALLKNTQSRDVNQSVGFPAGFDVRLIEGDLYCDRFERFQVFVNDREITKIEMMRKCSNYVKSTGTQWSTDEASGIGFLNIWELNFKPDETKRIKITFNLTVKKMPPIYKPGIKETWYLDLMNWLREDYANRNENQFTLPLNIGSFWSFYPDSIIVRTYAAKEWFQIVDKSKRSYNVEFIKRYEFSEPVGFYSPPEVEMEPVTEEQLQKMSKTELVLLRNSFFAKYGRKFEVAWLKKYFQNQPWYSENPSYHNWYLTRWDLDNVKMIYQYENNLK